MKVVGKACLLGICLVMFMTGCSNIKESTASSVPKPVTVQTAKVETKTTYLTYVGTVKSETVKKLGFTIGGRLGTVSAEKGETVKKGQLLAVLDKHQYQIGVDASSAQVEAARAVFKKSDEALKYLKDQLAKNEQLLKEGAINQYTYDELALKYQIAEQDYLAAKAQLNQAMSGLDQSEATLDNTRLVSDFEGKVIDVLYEKGEIIAAGYPVIVIQNKDQIFSFGISQRDYQALKLGTNVTVMVDGKSVKGKLLSISDTPDQATRTYEVQVQLTDGTFPLGAVGEVKIPNGQCKGVTIPLNVILSGEYEFVFVVENNKAVKKPVEILQVDKNLAIVSGLDSNEQIVIGGIKNIDSADDVKIQ